MPAIILVVDDNRLNLELVTELLTDAGHVVRQASSAEEGLRYAYDAPPDLILMDIGLPQMDGHAAVRELKASTRTRHVPTIALTAYAMAGDEERALQSGFDGYISKPIQTRTFAAAIGGWLANARGTP